MAGGSERGKDRPNVLLLMGDQHPVFYAGCYGHRSIRTPNLDRLAADGRIFDAAYAASPICAPCRAAMLTGRHVSTVEVWDNASPLRSDWPTIAHSFRAAGYRTILCGKMHFVGPDQHHGFEERWVQDIYPADFRWTRLSRPYAYYNDGQNIGRVLEAGVGWTPDMDYDEEVAHRTLHGLRRIRDHRTPFFMCVSFTAPHHPYKAPEAYFNQYSDADVDLPEVPEDYAQGEHEYVKWLRHHGAFDRLVPPEIARTARRAYMARTTMLDDYLGRVLACLEEQGLREDTIVIYTSDHGDMLGEHGLWFKNASYEWSSRVPLIFSGPGIPAGRSAEPASLLDLYSTLPALCGIAPVYPVTDGADLSALVRGARPDDSDRAVIMENYGEGLWRGVRMIRRGSLKLNAVSGCEPELFDLACDPGEWNNVAADPAYRTARADLEQRVHANWEPARLDERRWQSEERRHAIMQAMGGKSFGWQIPSTSPEHPLGYG